MRDKEFSITTRSKNALLSSEGIIESVIDDANALLQHICNTITDDAVAGDESIFLEPYKKGLETAVAEYDDILNDEKIDIMRERVKEILDIILEGLQDRSRWFAYSYRLTGTAESAVFGTFTIYLKRYDKVLDISNDEYSSVERRVSVLVNRLIQIT